MKFKVSKEFIKNNQSYYNNINKNYYIVFDDEQRSFEECCYSDCLDIDFATEEVFLKAENVFKEKILRPYFENKCYEDLSFDGFFPINIGEQLIIKKNNSVKFKEICRKCNGLSFTNKFECKFCSSKGCLNKSNYYLPQISLKKGMTGTAHFLDKIVSSFGRYKASVNYFVWMDIESIGAKNLIRVNLKSLCRDKSKDYQIDDKLKQVGVRDNFIKFSKLKIGDYE